MWLLFTRALATAGSALQVQVLNAGANLGTTALLGALLWGERVTPLWAVGALMVAAGTTLMSLAERDAAVADKAEGGLRRSKRHAA
jgi:hypothetical protein